MTGTKIWVDEGNAHKTRPDGITVELLADGAVVDVAPEWTKNGDTWSFAFRNLPAVTTAGLAISYTVREAPVEGYETAVNGTTITNTLIPRESAEYTELSGEKTWKDANNALGLRPRSITVHLLRDGEPIEQRTVTAATDWKYSFGSLPVDDGYGNEYVYEVREDAVKGYFARVDGLDINNALLITKTPEAPDGSEIDRDAPITTKGMTDSIESRDTGTPVPKYGDLTEEQLEELFELMGYGTPLFGMMGTGDDTPAWPYVLGGIGALALILLAVLELKKRRA